MKIISHRGNIEGPSGEENTPELIERAIQHGFEVEIDVRMIDEKLFLGHDNPDLEVSWNFINHHNFWIHAKNLECLKYMTSAYTSASYFWHQEDDFTLTSNRHIWTYPGKAVTDRSIIVALTKEDVENAVEKSLYGICTDYPVYAKMLLESKEFEKKYKTYIELCSIEFISPISFYEFTESCKLNCEYCLVLKETNCDCGK
jgi:hypothetical protein